MANFSTEQIDEIIRKQQILASARDQLLKEYIGIDQVINSVFDAVSPWFLFRICRKNRW
jgi:predicted RNA binding protein with dsRBD fold (UPF0201 family)